MGTNSNNLTEAPATLTTLPPELILWILRLSKDQALRGNLALVCKYFAYLATEVITHNKMVHDSTVGKDPTLRNMFPYKDHIYQALPLNKIATLFTANLPRYLSSTDSHWELYSMLKEYAAHGSDHVMKQLGPIAYNDLVNLNNPDSPAPEEVDHYFKAAVKLCMTSDATTTVIPWLKQLPFDTTHLQLFVTMIYVALNNHESAHATKQAFSLDWYDVLSLVPTPDDNPKYMEYIVLALRNAIVRTPERAPICDVATATGILINNLRKGLFHATAGSRYVEAWMLGAHFASLDREAAVLLNNADLFTIETPTGTREVRDILLGMLYSAISRYAYLRMLHAIAIQLRSAPQLPLPEFILMTDNDYSLAKLFIELFVEIAYVDPEFPSLCIGESSIEEKVAREIHTAHQGYTGTRRSREETLDRECIKQYYRWLRVLINAKSDPEIIAFLNQDTSYVTGHSSPPLPKPYGLVHFLLTHRSELDLFFTTVLEDVSEAVLAQLQLPDDLQPVEAAGNLDITVTWICGHLQPHLCWAMLESGNYFLVETDKTRIIAEHLITWVLADTVVSDEDKRALVENLASEPHTYPARLAALHALKTSFGEEVTLGFSQLVRDEAAKIKLSRNIYLDALALLDESEIADFCFIDIYYNLRKADVAVPKTLLARAEALATSAHYPQDKVFFPMGKSVFEQLDEDHLTAVNPDYLALLLMLWIQMPNTTEEPTVNAQWQIAVLPLITGISKYITSYTEKSDKPPHAELCWTALEGVIALNFLELTKNLLVIAFAKLIPYVAHGSARFIEVLATLGTPISPSPERPGFVADNTELTHPILFKHRYVILDTAEALISAYPKLGPKEQEVILTLLNKLLPDILATLPLVAVFRTEDENATKAIVRIATKAYCLFLAHEMAEAASTIQTFIEKYYGELLTAGAPDGSTDMLYHIARPGIPYDGWRWLHMDRTQYFTTIEENMLRLAKTSANIVDDVVYRNTLERILDDEWMPNDSRLLELSRHSLGIIPTTRLLITLECISQRFNMAQDRSLFPWQLIHSVARSISTYDPRFDRDDLRQKFTVVVHALLDYIPPCDNDSNIQLQKELQLAMATVGDEDADLAAITARMEDMSALGLVFQDDNTLYQLLKNCHFYSAHQVAEYIYHSMLADGAPLQNSLYAPILEEVATGNFWDALHKVNRDKACEAYGKLGNPIDHYKQAPNHMMHCTIFSNKPKGIERELKHVYNQNKGPQTTTSSSVASSSDGSSTSGGTISRLRRAAARVKSKLTKGG